MTNEELDNKFINYSKKYPVETCVFHNDIHSILNLPYYLKLVVSIYVDKAEGDPNIDHINSLRIEKQGDHGHAIYYSYIPKNDLI